MESSHSATEAPGHLRIENLKTCARVIAKPNLDHSVAHSYDVDAAFRAANGAEPAHSGHLPQNSPINIRPENLALDAGSKLDIRAPVGWDSPLFPVRQGLLCYAKRLGD
jgi:hypothetical protein